MKALFFLLRTAGVLLIIYAALVLYLNMRKDNILSFAYQEIEIKKESDSILVIGYRLGCARAKEYADSLTDGQLPVVARCIDPIYNEKDYLHRRYGIFYPKF
ncbi:hypothetical protein R83H12_01877 [Fibrobacteria bacterium R8-3-H12]